jgi:hypothetical protein
VSLLVGEIVGGRFVSWPEPDSVWQEQESGGIRRNPAESGGIRSKYRNSCSAGIPAKKSCECGQKQEFLQPPPKPRSCEKFLRKMQEKKKSSGILAGTVFLVQKINS